MQNHVTRVFGALSLLCPLVLAGACAQPVYLPPGVDDPTEDPFAGGDDSTSSSTDPPDGPTPQGGGCDDPTTCEYDLDTTCSGTPVANPSAYPPCPTSICASGGHCVPWDSIPQDEKHLVLDCDPDNSCVPDSFIERGGLVRAAACATSAGHEGRCLSQCLSIAAGGDPMGCAPDEACVPCFDPTTGASTGACNISCDLGPTQDPPPPGGPTADSQCCNDSGGGSCVPKDEIGDAHFFDKSECEALGLDNTVCVPQAILDATSQDGTFTPDSCMTDPGLQDAGFSADGGCLPSCIPIVGELDVPQGDCADGSACVPCDFDGVSLGSCGDQ